MYVFSHNVQIIKTLEEMYCLINYFGSHHTFSNRKILLYKLV